MRADRTRSGFTIVELLISVAITAFIALWIADWLRKPAQIQQMMLSTEHQRHVTNASDIMINDLTEADPASINWPQFPPISTATVSGITFWKLNYDLTNPGNVQQTNFQYQFQPDGFGTGALIRSVTANAVVVSSTIVLSPIDPPGVGAPSLIQADKSDPSDTVYSILVITLQYHPQGSAPISVMRRVAIAH